MKEDVALEVFSLALTVIALLMGVRLGYVVARRNIVAGAEVESNIRLMQAQLDKQREAEERERTRKELKASYEGLSGWLYDVVRDIDEVWAGCVSDDLRVQRKAKLIIDKWPWETLRVPRSVAPCEFYWSEEVHALIRKLGAPSAEFVNAAGVVMMRSARGEVCDQSSTMNVWEARDRVLRIVDDIRGQARSDLGVGI